MLYLQAECLKYHLMEKDGFGGHLAADMVVSLVIVVQKKMINRRMKS